MLSDAVLNIVVEVTEAQNLNLYLECNQSLPQLKKQLQVAEERRQSTVTELSAKHQKNLESLEALVIDALAERKKQLKPFFPCRCYLQRRNLKLQRWRQLQLAKQQGSGLQQKLLKESLNT